MVGVLSHGRYAIFCKDLSSREVAADPSARLPPAVRPSGFLKVSQRIKQLDDRVPELDDTKLHLMLR